MKFTLGIEMFESCLERFYERTRREDGAELEYRGDGTGRKTQARRTEARLFQVPCFCV